MGVKPEDIERAIAGGNRVLAQLKKVCPDTTIPEHNLPVTIPLPKPKKRIRQSRKPLLNELEEEFAAYYTKTTRFTLIAQAVKFRLGNGIWYKPDFLNFDPRIGITAFEVKGPYAFRGGFENLKVAASRYPDITWYLCWKENGQWREQLVLP